MKNKFLVIVSYLLIFFNSNLQGNENNNILKVGLLAPLSGEYKELGDSLLYSLQLALDEINDKNVLLIDDSIVRGTTSRQIIEMARNAGAKKVFFASAAPPVKFPNVYGIDMPATSELIASNKNDEDLSAYIGADWLIYQSLDDLIEAVRFEESEVNHFDTSCFSGEYVTNDITEKYLQRIELKRNDEAMAKKEMERKQLDIHDPTKILN